MRTAIVYCLLLLSTSTLSFGQIREDTGELYRMAIKAHLREIDRNRAAAKQPPLSNEAILIMNDAQVDLPKKIQDHVVQILGDSVDKFVKKGIGEGVIKLDPIRTNQGKIIVILNDVIARRTKGVVTYGISGGTAYTFVYDKDKKRYRILHTQEFGI